MLNTLKRDFICVREALNSLFGRQVPVGLVVLWYAVAAPIGLMMYPVVKWYWSRKLRKLIESMERNWDV